MKTIKISNGEVTIKDFCNRKLRKEINKALYENVMTQADGKLSGFSMEAVDKSNDVAMLGMIESLTIGGVIQPVTLETLDSLDAVDVDAIIAAVNATTQKQIPNA